MLAGLLRISYAFQLGLGAFLGNLLLPIEQTILRLLLGAAILPLLFQATLTFLSLGLATSSRYTDSSRWPTGLLRFVRVWRAEWYAALTIFAIRQPGRAHSPGIVLPAEPVAGGGENVPVLLVHGYICNHRVWDVVIPALRRSGHAVLALDLEPLFTGIDNYVGQVEAAVQSLRASTGRDQVALVGHSMGGLVIRAWMRAYGTEHVKRVVTLGSPHHGTQLAVLSWTPNGSQMRWKSEWLAQLAEQETPETRSLIQIALSDSDNIVFPQNDQTLEGSAVTVFSDLGHLEL